MTRRKKPRLFSFAREVEIGHFDEVVTDPAERRVLEELVDAFVEICHAQVLTPATLAAVEAAARHPAAYVRGVGLTRLTVLSHYFEEAVTLLRQLSGEEDEELRVYVTASLPNAPEAVALPLLEAAVCDVSWRVRKTAAQAASAFPAPQLLPALATALARENDARVKIQLRLSLEFQERSR